jgi:hypothetical protein
VVGFQAFASVIPAKAGISLPVFRRRHEEEMKSRLSPG